MITATHDRDPQATWDMEDASNRLARLHRLRQALTAAEEARSAARSAYAKAVHDEKLARAELLAALDVDARPCPLFDRRPEEPEIERNGHHAEEESTEPHLDQIPGKRLDVIPLADVLRSEHAEYLGQRGLKTLGDLVDLARREEQPLELVLKEKYALRLSDVVTILFDAVEWLKENPPKAQACERRCRECGCIEAECAPCYLRTGRFCRWVEEDLCSACQEQKEESLLAQEPEKAEEEKPNSLAHDCPKCRAKAGEKCRNYKGKGKAPCPQRGQPAPPPEPEPKEEPDLFTATSTEGEPWPEEITEEALQKASIVGLGITTLKKPYGVRPIRWQDRLWVYTGGLYTTTHTRADLLPIVPAEELQERFPGISLKLNPTTPETDEERLQYYTGCRLKVGKKEYAVLPAGEKVSLVKKVATKE